MGPHKRRLLIELDKRIERRASKSLPESPWTRGLILAAMKLLIEQRDTLAKRCVSGGVDVSGLDGPKLAANIDRLDEEVLRVIEPED